ncbi:MAG: DHH family phosphoesterase [Erysipelotrichaceae bacterium]|nr:DHH family phosphoesterase [Erysipelotrichaceae bacterium]
MGSLKEFLPIIETYDKILVLRHIQPDYDAFGSQHGLATWLREKYPQKVIVCGGYGNSILPGIIPEPVQVSTEWCKDALAISVDSSTFDRIDGKEWFSACAEQIKFDHHNNSEPYCTLSYVDERAGSCSEIITLGIFELQNEPLSKECAEHLYRGIISDTLRFSIETTSDKTLHAASMLLQTKLDVNTLNNQVFSVTLDTYRFRNMLRETADYTEEKFVYAIVPYETYTAFHQTEHSCKEQVKIFGEIRNIRAWAIFAQKKDGKYSASLRAHTLPIVQVAWKFGGGGHACAAGIPDMTYEDVMQAIEMLKETVK